MYLIEVNFQEQNECKTRFTYLVQDNIQLIPGDRVVVPVLEHYIFKVAIVIKTIKGPEMVKKIITDNSQIKYRYIAQKLDLTAYESTFESEPATKRL